MEEVLLRLRPSLPSDHRVPPPERHAPQAALADSWIGKPLPSIVMADETQDFSSSFLYEEASGERSSSSSEERSNLFVPSSEHEAWDCPGCPPPYFDLPPPPKPPFLEDSDSCSDPGSPIVSPYESCDNPLIIDSGAHLENDLLNVVVVVLCAIVLVAVILIVACVIWRKRRGGVLSPFRAKGQPHSPHTTHAHQFGSGSTEQTCSDSSSSGGTHFPKSHKLPSFFTSDRPPAPPQASQVAPGDHIELSEHPARHVYTNPNYPTLEIGGLPFYLMPAAAVEQPNGPLPPSDTVVHDTSLMLSPSAASSPQHAVNAFAPTNITSNPSNHIYEPGYTSGSQRSGPIYEDIDRMCTYRGSPPEFSPPQLPQQAGPQAPPRQQPALADDGRTYYNVLPPQLSRDKRPGSGGSSSHNCGTSSSEVSFESGSSPRHPPPPPPAPQNVLVNPLSPQHLSRLRASGGSGGQSLRSPQRGSPQTRSPPSSKAGSSVYYYSDTLRPKRSLGSADSDSGISNHNRSSEDTPPPMLPSSRMALAAAAALSCDDVSSRAGSTTASPRKVSRFMGGGNNGDSGRRKAPKGATTKV